MPELPEVEEAARRLRAAIVGKTIADVRVLHPSLRRRNPPARLRRLTGATVRAVERRGKHQLIILDDGRILHVHFRMTGDWTLDRVRDPLPRFARAAITFSDDTRAVLDDPRALSTLDVHVAGSQPVLRLGPEPADESLTVGTLMAALAKRRGPIKPVLLDQRVIAGLGNIYAVEALWLARVSPAAPASKLSRTRVGRLLAATRDVLKAASAVEYADRDGTRFAVYDREGHPCQRCGARIKRIVQAGRSTYYCPRCQSR